MLTTVLIMSGLVTVGSAHMMMSNPVPYGKSSLNNRPLLADGSDFPYKQRANVYSAEGASNVYQQGSTQQLSFLGSAVHGGGSCQISVTTDAKPRKNSVWKVIKSIEGGCPAKNQAGNMPANAYAAAPYKYDFTIPKEMASGNYTLAWTWFNKIGNREMYMNCAPMTVQGEGGSAGFLDTLPNMFVANVGNGCGNKDSTDLKFPNPGKDVDRFNGATSAFSPPSGACPTSVDGGGNTAPEPSAQPPAPSKGYGGGRNGGSSSRARESTAKSSAPSKSYYGGSAVTSAPYAVRTYGGVPGGVFITVPGGTGSQP